jgi:hypothetical protein
MSIGILAYILYSKRLLCQKGYLLLLYIFPTLSGSPILCYNCYSYGMEEQVGLYVIEQPPWGL